MLLALLPLLSTLDPNACVTGALEVPPGLTPIPTFAGLTTDVDGDRAMRSRLTAGGANFVVFYERIDEPAPVVQVLGLMAPNDGLLVDLQGARAVAATLGEDLVDRFARTSAGWELVERVRVPELQGAFEAGNFSSLFLAGDELVVSRTYSFGDPATWVIDSEGGAQVLENFEAIDLEGDLLVGTRPGDIFFTSQHWIYRRNEDGLFQEEAPLATNLGAAELEGGQVVIANENGIEFFSQSESGSWEVVESLPQPAGWPISEPDGPFGPSVPSVRGLIIRGDQMTVAAQVEQARASTYYERDNGVWSEQFTTCGLELQPSRAGLIGDLPELLSFRSNEGGCSFEVASFDRAPSAALSVFTDVGVFGPGMHELASATVNGQKISWTVEGLDQVKLQPPGSSIGDPGDTVQFILRSFDKEEIVLDVPVVAPSPDLYAQPSCVNDECSYLLRGLGEEGGSYLFLGSSIPGRTMLPGVTLGIGGGTDEIDVLGKADVQGPFGFAEIWLPPEAGVQLYVQGLSFHADGSFLGTTDVVTLAGPTVAGN